MLARDDAGSPPSRRSEPVKSPNWPRTVVTMACLAEKPTRVWAWSMVQVPVVWVRSLPVVPVVSVVPVVRVMRRGLSARYLISQLLNSQLISSNVNGGANHSRTVPV